MSVETETRLSYVVPTFDSGGCREPDFSFSGTIVEARVTDRILPSVEPHKHEINFIELAPDLIINPHLKMAGYDVVMEMGRLLRNVNSGIEVEAAASELEVNLRTYDLEIIKSRPVLPHLNRFDRKNGNLRMVGNNGEPVVDAISGQERKGAVLEASKAIENFLLSAENNSFAVLMNPAGWNGFTDEYGREAEPHLNAEIMVFWKDQNGRLKGLTLVADLEEEQARKTMVSLGVTANTSKGEEQERLANIVRNPALLSLPEVYANPFIYVLDKMLAQRGGDDFRLRMRDGTAEIRSVEEVRTDIKRLEELLLFLQEEERLVAEPAQFILEEADRLGDKSVQQEIINKIEKAILMLTRKYLQNINQRVIFTHNITPPEWKEQEMRNDFSPEIMFLKSRAGCPASAAARILGGSSLGSGVGGAAGGGLMESDSKGSLSFPCPACGTINKRPKEGYVESCQNPSCPNPAAVRC